jgi:hypothetical protein
MALANVALTDTFDTWRVRTNQLIVLYEQSNNQITSAFSGVPASFAQANLAFDKANAANVLAFNSLPKSGGTLTGSLELFGNFDIIGSNNTTVSGNNTTITSGNNITLTSNNTVLTSSNNNTLTGSNTTVTSNVITFTTNNVTFNSNTITLRSNNVIITGNNTTLTGNVNIAGNTLLSGHTISFTANIASQVLSDGATINWNLSSGSVAFVTLGGNRTLANPTNMKVGSYIIHVIQDGSGNRTLSFGSSYKWPAGVAPVLSTTANARDIFSFVCDGINMYGSFLPDVK